MDGRRLPQARENEAERANKWENVHATDGQGPRDFPDSTVIVGMGETDPQVALDRAGRRSAASGAGGEHLAARRKRLRVGRAIQHRLERDSSDFSGLAVLAGSEIAGGIGRNVRARRVHCVIAGLEDWDKQCELSPSTSPLR